MLHKAYSFAVLAQTWNTAPPGAYKSLEKFTAKGKKIASSYNQHASIACIKSSHGNLFCYRFSFSFLCKRSSESSNLGRYGNPQYYQGPKFLLSSSPSTSNTWFPSSGLQPDDGPFWLGTLVIITSISRKGGWERKSGGGRGAGGVTAVCTTIKEEITFSNFHVHILVHPNLGGNILAEHLQLNGFQ